VLNLRYIFSGKVESTLPINVSTPILTAEEGTKFFHLVSYNWLTLYTAVLSAWK